MRCESCDDNKMFLQFHHKFPQTKVNKKLYGDLIHSDVNRQLVCENCHTSHASKGLIHWSEREFCEALGIAPRSKTERMRNGQEASVHA
jgi:hypothetical protein